MNPFHVYAMKVVRDFSADAEKTYGHESDLLQRIHLGTSKGLYSWQRHAKTEDCYLALYNEHVAGTVAQHMDWSLDHTVLELGAGFLKNGHSRLSAALPKAKIVHSDLNPLAVENAVKQFPTVDYVQVDSINIVADAELRNLDAVVGSCFLDTLPQTELDTTLEQVLAVLKDGGKLFHISDLDPFQDTLLLDHLKEGSMMFPLIEGSFLVGLQFVSREDCLHWINGQDPTFLDRKVLEEYMQISPEAKTYVIRDLIERRSREDAAEFSRWIEKTFVGKTRKVLNEQFFSERLKAALEKAGFNTLQFGLETREEMAARTPLDGKHHNDFHNNHGIETIKRDPSLPQNVVRKRSTVHLIVAQKPKSVSA